MKRQPIDMAIRNTLTRQCGRTTGDCPDDSLIAAYLESRLQPDEAARFEAHAAVCPSCREVLALSMQLGQEPDAPATAPLNQNKKQIFHFAIPVSVVALILVASFVGLLYFRTVHEAAREPAVVATAELHAPAKEAKTAVPPASIPAPASPSRQMADNRETGRLERASGPISAESPAKPAQTLNERRERDKLESLAPTDEFDARTLPALEAEAFKSKSIVGKETFGAPSPAAVGGMVAQANLPQETGLRSRRAGMGAASVVDSKDMHLQKAAPAEEAKGAKAEFSRADRQNALTDQSSTPRARSIGGRTFTLVGDVWMDDESRSHPSLDLLEIKRDSSQFEEIRKGIPGIEALITDTVRVQVFWKDKTYLVGP